jgi:hypothetical protein
VSVLAAASTSTSAWDEPGTLGFLVVFGMGVILYFVFRSMARHLRKVRQAAWAEQAEQAEREQAAQEQSSSHGAFADDPFLRSSGGNGPPRRA